MSCLGEAVELIVRPVELILAVIRMCMRNIIYSIWGKIMERT